MKLTHKIVGNAIPFDQITFRNRPLRRLTMQKNHPINGVDTETLDGYCRLISDHQGNYSLIDNIDDLLEYLTQRRFRSHHNFFFNLRFDMNAVIKYLPIDNLKELYKRGKTMFKGYKIGYIPKKLFNITKAKHMHKYFDIAQFYETSLEEASSKYLKLPKMIEDIDREELGTSASYWRDKLPEIIRYCTNDADLCKRLGELLQETLKHKIKLTPQNYISKASLAKEYIRKRVSIPDITKLDPRAMKIAFNAYHGGRFEILKKGRVGKCTLIDINSAYPHKIANLVDVTTGQWKRVRSLHEQAIYGYYLVKVFTHYKPICPLAYQHPNKVTCFPVIEYVTYLTKNELLAYEKAISYEIVSGWEYYEDNPTYPFRSTIEEIYAKKQVTDPEHYEYDLWKKIMNSIYGSFYEKIKRGETWRAGKLFNPMYATEITADTRIQCYLEALKYDGKVVGFATDSLLIKGTVKGYSSKELGEWGFDMSGKATVLRSGMYQIGKKLKSRGIRKAKKLRTPHGEYKDLFTYIKAQPQLTIYPVIMRRPINFVEALIHHKKRSVADINVFIDLPYKIDINRDHKRLWADRFESGGELFEKEIKSQPLVIME